MHRRGDAHRPGHRGTSSRGSQTQGEQCPATRFAESGGDRVGLARGETDLIERRRGATDTTTIEPPEQLLRAMSDLRSVLNGKGHQHCHQRALPRLRHYSRRCSFR